jgi:2,4-dienoyl-CoA reductase-like NADH-dependent reductase (Old Yellow Enzyme family)
VIPALFQPLTIRGVTFKNRIAVSPMCQYSCQDGLANDWHLVHLGSRAVGGAALVMVEATAVTAEGRISPQDMGIWTDSHVQPLARIAKFISEQGAVPAIQLAHAGRKACTKRPWEGNVPIIGKGQWQAVAPSAIAFDQGYQVPQALAKAQIADIVTAFADGARRALKAGFQTIEIHAAHGYLLHSFLSPMSNTRQDEFGGSLENRLRALLQVTSAVRAVMPDSIPLLVRISATDWLESGGWDLEQSKILSKQLAKLGADLIDCSSGGNLPRVKIPVTTGYQVPFAESIKRECGILTGAVGMITEPQQAEQIIKDGKADIILLARQVLRDPYWPLHAAQTLDYDMPWPPQYDRAKK